MGKNKGISKLADMSITKSSKLIAYDGSGSTGGQRNYHDKSAEILLENPTAEILFWDSGHRIITRLEMKEINSKLRGFGGTEPRNIAEYVKAKDFHGDLIIITDGQCGNSSVDACSALLPDWHFDSVICYLIGSSSSVNQSITCPFTRNAASFEVINIDPHGVVAESNRISAEDWKVLETIENISSVKEFEMVFETLKKTIVAKTMGLASGIRFHSKTRSCPARPSSSNEKETRILNLCCEF